MNTPKILGDLRWNKMAQELWLPDAKAERIADRNSASIKRRQEVGYLSPGGYQPEPLFGAHLDMPPAELEETIIETVTSDPDLLAKIDGVKIYYNADAECVPAGGGDPLNFLLIAYKGKQLFCNERVELTTALLEAAGLQDKFKPYQFNLYPEDLARKQVGGDEKRLQSMTYQTQKLELHSRG